MHVAETHSRLGRHSGTARLHMIQPDHTPSHTAQVWKLGGEKDQGAGLELGTLIQRYGQSFAASAPDIALEYYMLAAQAMGGTADAKGRLLRDLLTQSNAFGFLLGSGGGSGGGGESVSRQLLSACMLLLVLEHLLPC